MKLYDWLTFDCYGTLIDWEGGIFASLEKLCREKAAGVDPTTLPARYIETEHAVEGEKFRPYREVLRVSVERLFKKLGVALTEEEARVLVRTLPAWQPFPEVKKTLSRLGERCRLAILSNIDDDLIAHSVRRMGVRFDAIITAEGAATCRCGFAAVAEGPLPFWPAGALRFGRASEFQARQNWSRAGPGAAHRSSPSGGRGATPSLLG